MKSYLALLGLLIAGCTTPSVKQEFAFTQSPNDAFDCAIFAARDVGLGIGSSDASAGIFSAMSTNAQLGGMLTMGARQFHFAVDKKIKTVSVRVDSYNQLSADVAPVNKLIAEFQASFKKRCSS